MNTLDDLFPSKYLKAGDFVSGPRVMKIARFDFAEMKSKDGKDERKPVVYFVGEEKGLVLNKTNRNAIEAVCNSIQLAEIIGRDVELFVARVDSFGEMVDAIRVRSPQAAQLTPAQRWTKFCKDGEITQEIVLAALGTVKPSEWIAQQEGRTLEDAIATVNAHIESQF